MKLVEISTDKIDWPKRLRGIDEALVETLMADFIRVGQLQPIMIRPADGKKQHKGTIGFNRYEACRRLDRPIFAVISKMTEKEAHDAELSENLYRNLCALDRMVFLSASKDRYEEDHPETKHGAQGGRGGNVNEDGILPFSKAAAENMGMSNSTITKAVQIARNLDPKVIKKIANTPLANKQNELADLSAQPAAQQMEIVKRLAAKTEDAPKTVNQAVKAIEGREKEPELSPEDKQLKKLMDAWVAANASSRENFLTQLRETGELGGV